MITQAAILYNNKTYTGKSHAEIFKAMKDQGLESPKGEEIQGFVDEDNKFYTRAEAATDVLDSGQIKELKWPPLLYSEDLYD